MRSKICPYRSLCVNAGACDDCSLNEILQKQDKKIKKLKERCEALSTENAVLSKKIEILKGKTND